MNYTGLHIAPTPHNTSSPAYHSATLEPFDSPIRSISLGSASRLHEGYDRETLRPRQATSAYRNPGAALTDAS